MSSHESILAILHDVPAPRVAKFGHLWQIGFSWVSGSDEDGDKLAQDLRRKWRADPAPRGYASPPEQPDPIPDIPIPEFLEEPDPRDAEIAALKAELERAKVHIEKQANVPPPDLADLIELADTPAETNDKLLARLREVLGFIGLAEDAGGRAAPELYRRRDRLESGVRWNRGRMAEQL